MPIKRTVQKQKPTTEEKETAKEMQSPSKLRRPSNANGQPKMRTLKEAHLDSERIQFVKARQLFSSYDPNEDTVEEDDNLSMPFVIHNASRREGGRYGTMVNFTLSLEGEEEKMILSLTDNEERSAFVSDFKTNSSPIANCALAKLELENGQSYYKIVDKDSDIPF